VISPLAHLVPTAPSAHGGSRGRPAADSRDHQMSRKRKNNGINNPDLICPACNSTLDLSKCVILEKESNNYLSYYLTTSLNA